LIPLTFFGQETPMSIQFTGLLRNIRGQYVVVIPSHDLVIVRRGLDYNGAAFDHWSLVREVLKAFPTNEN